MEVTMEINRDVYLNRLIVRKHNGFIKVITGIRRSGKSYLLNILFYKHLIDENIPDDHIIKFAFDSAEDLYFGISRPIYIAPAGLSVRRTAFDISTDRKSVV